jgi:hypothetical protein
MSFEDEMKRRNMKLDVKADTWLDDFRAGAGRCFPDREGAVKWLKRLTNP